MEKDILAEAKDAFAECVEAESEQRSRMLDDLRFARLGEQWPDKVKKAREAEGRPCLTINRQPAFIRQVVNDARQNKPSIKVHPADSNADLDTAKIYDGLIRNIEYVSSADVAYDTGIDHAASMGIGYWRVAIEYARDDSFDLDLRIKRVPNVFTVYGDPRSQEADSSDWNVGFVTEVMKREEFKRLYPKAETASWEGDGKDAKNALWFEGEDVRRAEYWKRDEVERKLLLLSDGTAMLEEDFLKVDPETGLSARDIASAQGITVARERMTRGYRLKQYMLAADDVLETNDWPGIYIPIVPVYGEEINVEGERRYLSLIHNAKDAQRMENFWRTLSTELVALAPKSPYIGEENAFTAEPEKWATANVKSYPYIAHANGTAPPQRQPFAGPPAGAIQEAMMAVDDQKSILGLYDASLGARSNETSGRAIMARQREGDTSTFHFIDNLTRAIRHTGRILIDLIPHVYTEERIVRVMGEDGTPQTVTINTQEMGKDGQMRRVNDVTAGKYDLTVSSGPSFTTRREEAAYQMTEMGRAVPQLFEIAGDLIAKNLDWPGADELAERLKSVNPIVQKQEADKKTAMMLEAGMQPPEPQPDPAMVEAAQKSRLEQDRFGFEVQKTQAQMLQEQKAAEAQLALKKYEIDANLQLKAGMDAAKQREIEGKLALKDKEIEAKLQQQQMQLQADYQLKLMEMRSDMMAEMQKLAMQQASERESLLMKQATLEQAKATGPVATVQIDGKEELEGMAQLVGQGVGIIAQAAQTMAESQQASAGAAGMMAEAAQMLAQAATAPKRIIRDAEGRPVGVETMAAPRVTEPQEQERVSGE